MRQFVKLETLLTAMHVVSIPTRTRFRGVSAREAVVFEGSKRWSEFSPFPEYGDEEAATWLTAAIEYGWADLPKINTSEVAVNATVPAVSAAEVPRILARFPGSTTVKVKVAEKGQTLADDVARVAAVREAIGDAGLIRVDANAAWSVAEALMAAEAFAPYRIDYMEQPVATISQMTELRAALSGSVKIAADELVRRADDPLDVARAGAADLLVVKAQPLGGITRALQIVQDAGLPVVVSSALDTSVGVGMGLRLAASLPPGMLYGASGLGTVALLDGDVVEDSLLPHGGALPVGDVAASSQLLERYAASAERESWWRERVIRCFAVIHDSL